MFTWHFIVSSHNPKSQKLPNSFLFSLEPKFQNHILIKARHLLWVLLSEAQYWCYLMAEKLVSPIIHFFGYCYYRSYGNFIMSPYLFSFHGVKSCSFIGLFVMCLIKLHETYTCMCPSFLLSNFQVVCCVYSQTFRYHLTLIGSLLCLFSNHSLSTNIQVSDLFGKYHHFFPSLSSAVSSSVDYIFTFCSSL